jgi:hypothetical protein
MSDGSAQRLPLRRGGWLRVDEANVHIRRDGEEDVSVSGEDIRKIKLQVFDYTLGVISAAAVAFGAYFAVSEQFLVGIGIALVGGWSLYRSYRERYTLVIWVDGRPKPLAVYPEDPQQCHAAVARVVRPDEAPVTEQ